MFLKQNVKDYLIAFSLLFLFSCKPIETLNKKDSLTNFEDFDLSKLVLPLNKDIADSIYNKEDRWARSGFPSDPEEDIIEYISYNNKKLLVFGKLNLLGQLWTSSNTVSFFYQHSTYTIEAYEIELWTTNETKLLYKELKKMLGKPNLHDVEQNRRVHTRIWNKKNNTYIFETDTHILHGDKFGNSSESALITKGILTVVNNDHTELYTKFLSNIHSEYFEYFEYVKKRKELNNSNYSFKKFMKHSLD